MADKTLTNIASVAGTYNSIPVTLETEAVVTQLIDGLSITKTADKQNWATGILTYTIDIKNNAESPLEDSVISDTLDPTLITLIEDSVTVNGTSKTPVYNATTGIMTVDVGTIEVGGESQVSFQVQKA